MRRRLAALLLLLVWSVAAKAADQATAGGQTCFFRAGDRDNPFRRWLTSQQVTCVAGNRVNLPVGLWNVFARNEGLTPPAAKNEGLTPSAPKNEGLTPTAPKNEGVTPAPQAPGVSPPVVVEGGAGVAVEGLSLAVRAAGRLVVRLPEGLGGAVYATRSASAFPIDAASGLVVVPAGEALWVFVMEKGAIASIFPLAPLEAGDERDVDAVGGGVNAVVGWLQVPEDDRAAVRNVDGVAPPQVRVGLRDADALPSLQMLNGAFVFVRGVEAGDRELAIGGRGWLANRRSVKIADRVVTIVEQPLLVRGAATLLVSWSAGVDMASLDRSLGSCTAPSDQSGQYAISVSACANPESCAVIREETGVPEISFGSFSVEDVPPGLYRAELNFGKLPPVTTTVTAAPFEQKTMRLFSVYDTLYGSVTRGGEPLGKDAKIKFPGDGIGFFSTDSDEYRGVVKGQIETDQEIEITTCDKELHVFVLTDRGAGPRSRFDLEIPDNQLVIDVIDTFSRQPLDAKVKYVVMSKRVPEKPVVTRTLKSRTIDGVPLREIRLTVSHPGYQTNDVAPFTMSTSGTKTVEVQLVPLRGSSGRIVSPQPFEAGRVTWLSADGIETEHAEVAADGTFIYTNRHEAGETMAVTSFSHPLWVFRMLRVARGQTLELPFPMMPTRAFEVSVPRNDPRFIGLRIGGLLVPQVALHHHQTLRELPSFARSRHPMPFRDILETGPIDILLGPLNADVPSYGRVIDPFVLSMSANAPRKRLEPGVTKIAFE